MQTFFDLPYEQLASTLRASGFSPAHARALYQNVYKRLAKNAWNAPGMPQKLTLAFGEEFRHLPAKIKTNLISRYDGTVKFIVGLEDGEEVEMVLIPEKERITLCVSSQVGCKQACTFCHTGRMGLRRHLSAGEIVAEVYLARQWIAEHPEWVRSIGKTPSPRLSVTNIVFMGMGEPLDNVDAVVNAINVLTHPSGFAIGLRRISVSTAGHLEGLDRLLAAIPRIPIAISLHSPFDGERSKIMPINRRWPLADVVAAIKRINDVTGRSVLIQYTVINGVNDSMEHAKALVELMRGVDIKVNLIPLNEIDPSRFRSPEPETLLAFKDFLHNSGIRVMVRYSKGQDIAGACGQLVS